MTLSDKKILEMMENGSLIIKPFSRENLSTSSYDVSLGENYYREGLTNESRIYNPHDKEDVAATWIGPHRAEKAEEVFKGIDFKFGGIKKDDKVILIDPGETILCHTEEFIGGVKNITTMMKARSSIGRNFLEICKCAGWGDVGYTNRWTMEITNNSRLNKIPLVVGRRVAQIIFFETGTILEDDYTKKGKYQNSNNIEELEKNCDPSQMLPRMYNDRENKN